MKRALCIATLVLSAQASAYGQTIADIARQERARREAIATKTVVLTNESLKNLPPATTAAAPSQATAEQEKQTTPAAAPARNEKDWRDAFKNARDEIKRAEDRVTLLQLDLNRANRDYLQRSDVYNREFRIGAEIADIKARLDGAQKELEATKHKLALLEEEFRRSGAPAGWAR